MARARRSAGDGTLGLVTQRGRAMQITSYDLWARDVRALRVAAGRH